MTGAPSRRGTAALAVLVVVAAATAALAVAGADRAHRLSRLGWHRVQVQGREFALGAWSLAPGGEVVVGPWRMTRTATAAVAEHRRGRYLLVRRDDGSIDDRGWQGAR